MERPYDVLQHELKALAGISAAIFSGLCAERLSACVWSFGRQENLSSAVFAEVMAENWKAMFGERASPRLSSLTKELHLCIPHDEDYSYSLAAQAQNGFLCAAHCANITLTGDPSDARGSSDNCISATELYLFAVRKGLGRATVRQTNEDGEELVAREINKQLADLKQLKALGKPSQDELVDIRRVNYQFSIPPAVMIGDKLL